MPTVTEYQKIQDWWIKITFLGEIEMTFTGRSGIKYIFGIENKKSELNEK